MRSMTRDDYMAALKAARYVKNPTPEDMLAVCPHLTRQQALDGLMGSQDGSIALPPVRIRGSYRIASYYTGDPTQNLPPSFHGGESCHRTLRSYTDGRSHGDVFEGYPFIDEATAYAERHWPEELILDTWIDFLTVYVQDPHDVKQGIFGGPRTKFVVSIGLGRDWNELGNDHSKPEVELWDESIIVASVNRVVSAELKGGRASYTRYNCAHCGGGLSLTYCSACRTRFPDNQFRTGWDTPLPPKLIKLIRDHGHKFGLDPERLLVRPETK